MLLAAGLCFAQEAQPPQVPQPPPVPQNPAEPGQEAQPAVPQDGKAPAPAPEDLLGRLTRELKLDDAQQAEFKRLLDEQREGEFKLRTSSGPSQEFVERVQKTREEMKKARDAGDMERMKQLREELMAANKEREAQMAPIQEKVEELKDQIHDQLLTVLREDQKVRFEDVWDQHMGGSSGQYGGQLRNPRVLKAAVDKLRDLTPEQKQQIGQLFDDFRKAGREPQQGGQQQAGQQQGGQQQGGAKNRRDMTKKLYDDVVAQLTPEQKAAVEKALQGSAGPRGQQKRPRGPGQPAPEGEQPPQGQQPAQGETPPPAGEQPVPPPPGQATP
jgi:hypothetical protein